jgi:hypothetical protein
MGGSISKRTVETLLSDPELYSLIDCIETRKVVMKVQEFIKPGALEAALAFELAILESKLNGNEIAVESAKKRRIALSSRL